MIWRVMVVLPEDSGPKISMTRPRGTPPTPRAASKEMEPVEMTEIGTTSFEPSRMMEPLPNCFSSPERASSIALLRSSATIFHSCGWVKGRLMVQFGILAFKTGKANKRRINYCSAGFKKAEWKSLSCFGSLHHRRQVHEHAQ